MGKDRWPGRDCLTLHVGNLGQAECSWSHSWNLRYLNGAPPGIDLHAMGNPRRRGSHRHLGELYRRSVVERSEPDRRLGWPCCWCGDLCFRLLHLHLLFPAAPILLGRYGQYFRLLHHT